MRLLSLAWRNLSRYKKRTMLTAVAIAFGIWMYIFVDGLLLGLELDSERNLRWYETGSAQIVDDEYLEHQDAPTLRYVVENPASIIEELEARNLPAAPRVSSSGEMLV